MKNVPTSSEILQQSEEIISAEVISAAIDRWAIAIRKVCREPNLLVLAVLRGGMIPATWLTSRMSQALELDCIHVTRYGGGIQGGELQWLYQPRSPLKGRQVLVVDDIYDEGYTLQAITQWCQQQGASSVYTATLLRKLHSRGRPRDEVDFYALDVDDYYVFGCGMDCYEHWRHLTSVYRFNGA